MSATRNFVWLGEWTDLTSTFTLEQLGHLMRMVQQHVDGNEPQPTDDKEVAMAYRFIAGGVDRSIEKYEEICKKREDASRRRWEKQKQANESKSMQMDTSVPNSNPNPIPNPNSNPNSNPIPNNNPKDDDDNARGMSSVVVGLLDFLRNIYGDFNFTPSQVQLIMSKPADYWESFMDEVQASKWLKGKDPALALRLHEKVVNGEYRTYTDKAKPEQPQPAPYKPTPEEQQLNELLDEWRTLPKDAYKGDNLDEMRKRHGQLPDEFLKSIGMCFFRGSWYWKS